MDTTYGVLCLIPPIVAIGVGPVDQADNFLFVYRSLAGLHHDERI